MKKVKYLLALICFSLILICCCPTTPPVCQSSGDSGIGPNIDLSSRYDDELVLRFTEKLKPVDEEELKRLQDSILAVLGVNRAQVEIEYCPCGDSTIQKWSFDPQLDIETKVSGMKDQGGGNNVEGDMEFSFTLPVEGDPLPVDPRKFYDTIMPPFIGQAGEGIGIAVLDTGIDLNFVNPETLFKNPSKLSCGVGFSGWNFVGNNPNIQDDHSGVGHGTLVAKTITLPLEGKVKYRIVPLKVFDRTGKASYWDIICAMSFVNEINTKAPGAISIVNASFGGSLGNIPEERVSILRNLISDMEKEVMVIASAGNCHFNTDPGSQNHYPSGYSSENIIAVGGYTEMNQNIVIGRESNYGKVNIDVAAEFQQKLDFMDNGGNMYTLILAGTSYSAAHVSSLFAEFLSTPQGQVGNALTQKQSFLSNGSSHSRDLECFITKGRYFQ